MPKTISQFFTNHLWQILTVAFFGAVAVIVLQTEMVNTILRVDAIETVQADFPTKEWFELKFETEREYNDLRFNNLEEKILNCRK